MTVTGCGWEIIASSTPSTRNETSSTCWASAIAGKFIVDSEPNNITSGMLVHPCRLAVTGKTSGPSLYHLLQVLGKERVLARIEKALEHAGFNTEVDEKTRLWFSLSLDWLPNLQSFFADQGITLPEGNFIQAIDQRRENNLVRASQPETENERSKIFHPLSVISTIEKIGKALFDYLAD